MNTSSFFIPVVVAGCFYAFGQYISAEPARNQEHNLTVQAVGVGKSVPNIAHVTLGVQVQPQPTAKEATDMLAKQGNTVLAAMKNLGIAEADLKTLNVSVQPSYTYQDGKQALRGYEGNEQIDVTVRKTDQTGDVIARGSESGANQIGGVTFKSEDSETSQLAAEKDGIANAQKKAEELASALHVHLGKVKNYTTSQNYPGPLPYASEMKAMGGDAVTAPQLPVGTQENSVTVTVTYDIR